MSQLLSWILTLHHLSYRSSKAIGSPESGLPAHVAGFAYALVLLTILWLLFAKYRQSRKKWDNKAPLFPGQGLFGCVFWYRLWKASRAGDVQGRIRACFSETGLKTFRTTSCIQEDTLHVVDRQNLKAILSDITKFGKGPRKDIGWFHPTWVPFLEGGMLVSDGHEWRTYRKAAKGCLRKEKLKGLEKLDPIVEEFLNSMPGTGENRDYQDDVISFSKDAVLGFLMGWDHKVSKSRWAAIREDADYCSSIIYRRFRKTALEHLLF